MSFERIRSRKRNRLVFRFALIHFLVATMGGVVLVASVSRDINHGFALLIFCSTIALTSSFIAHLDRIFMVFRLRKVPFIALQLIRLIVITFLILLILGVFHYFRQGHFILKPEHINVFFDFLGYSTIVSLFISLMVIINRMLGYGVIFKYMYGKYHKPIEDNRIVMFIDLKSSTTMAEQLGNKRFFSLLNDVLFDITNIIVENDGEIYKYVGDAIIIIWNLKKGVRNNNCLHVFFEIEEKLKKNEKRYQKEYGVIPEMKAGLHVGKVIVGELGDFRSEIAYMGDVVNMASRIQSQCNELNTNILFSGELEAILQKPTLFHIHKVVTTNLKGRQNETELYSALIPME